MWTPNPGAWTVRGATFALWALAAGSAMVWGLKLGGGQRPMAVPMSPVRQVAAADPATLARLLGSSPAATGPAATPTLASRFRLLGVAAGASGGGGAVISVDGKPARSYRVGSSLDEGVILQSVHERQAVLAGPDGAPVATLELPPAPPLVGLQNPLAGAQGPGTGVQSPTAGVQTAPLGAPPPVTSRR